MKPALRILLFLPVLAFLPASCGSGGGGGGGGGGAPPSGLSYAENPAAYTVGFAIQDNVPSVTGTVTAWSVLPALPAGLALDPATGVVSGTPLSLQPATDHVVTATNADGSTSVALSIAVGAPAARALYVASAADGTVGSFLLDGVTHSGYATTSGAGARALAVSPDGAWVFAASDATGLVTTFAADSASGRLAATGATAAAGAQPSALAVRPDGGFLFVASRGDDAVLSFAIGADGALSGGAPAPAGDEPCALLVDPTGRFLYVASAGSSDVQLFTIDASSGALTPGGAVAVGAAPSALALAVHAAGAFLYVACEGGDAIAQLAADATTGALSSLGADVPLAPGAAPSDLVADPDGALLLVANRGDDTVAGFSIDPATGLLAPLSPATVPTGGAPSALALDPSGETLYVAHQDDDELHAYAVDAAGALARIEVVRTRGEPVDVVLGPAQGALELVSRHAYVTSGGVAPANVVAQFAVDAAAADLTALAPATVAPAGPSPRGLALHPDGEVLLVTSETGSAISIFARSAASGLLTLVSDETVGNTSDVEIDPSGRFAYATQRLVGVQPYALDADPAAPDLAPLTLATAGTDPRNLDVDPTGRFLYAAETTGGVFAFEIDPATGELTALGSVAGGGGTLSVDVHPSGRFLYATNATGHSISMYAVGTDGVLTPLAPPSVATGPGTNPSGLVQSRDGAHLYVALAGTDEVAHFTVDETDGQLAFVASQETFAQQPRELALDASGRVLLAPNAGSTGIVRRFAVDPATGAHTGAGFDLAGSGGAFGAVFSVDYE